MSWLGYFHIIWVYKKKSYCFLFIFKALYSLWLPAWSGQYWKFLNQFYCVLWSLQQLLQSPEGEGRTRRRKSQNSNLPGGSWREKGLLSYSITVLDASSLCSWVTPCWYYSLPFKVENAMTYYLLGKTTKTCLRVAWLAARHWATFYTFLTDGCTSLLRPCSQRIHRDGLHISCTGDNDWHIHTASPGITHTYAS